jgi:hypothetical protein
MNWRPMRAFSEKHAPAMSISPACLKPPAWPLWRKFMGWKARDAAFEEAAAASPTLGVRIQKRVEVHLGR